MIKYLVQNHDLMQLQYYLKAWLYGLAYKLIILVQYLSVICRLYVAEKLWLPLGPVLGGRADGRVLLHGLALVRSGHRHLHRTHRLPEDGERVQCPRRAASVPRSEVRPFRRCGILSTINQPAPLPFNHSDDPSQGAEVDWHSGVRSDGTFSFPCSRPPGQLVDDGR